jgi:hypothetical protein
MHFLKRYPKFKSFISQKLSKQEDIGPVRILCQARETEYITDDEPKLLSPAG